ncbi:hypothetical protein LtaPh_0406200 [Leishmania tarentolae]|uniref:Uncharacterized protein n=1 Tax=Leishmania tarentolae TaxID=5689 RepID=A0A640KDT1_LEITA|nr:hypothetical protein LtaPh_0406200 [Leishmania tarentolae]
MSNGEEQVIALLQELGATALPKFVDSGEALTYMAYRDGVLEKAIRLLNSEYIGPSSNSIQPLRVNSEQLANSVIERIFDEHTQVLRSKLAEAEKVADMWKKVALFGGAEKGKSVCHTAPAQLTLPDSARVSIGLQVCGTDDDAAASESNMNTLQCEFLCEAVKKYLEGWCTEMLSIVEEKLQLWLSSQLYLASVTVSQHKHEVAHLSFDDGLLLLDKQNSVSQVPSFIGNAKLSSETMSRAERNKSLTGTMSSSIALSPDVNPMQQLILSPLDATTFNVPGLNHPQLGMSSPGDARAHLAMLSLAHLYTLCTQ